MLGNMFNDIHLVDWSQCPLLASPLFLCSKKLLVSSHRSETIPHLSCPEIYHMDLIKTISGRQRVKRASFCASLEEDNNNVFKAHAQSPR